MPTATPLKRKLLSTGLKQYRCEICSISDWLGNPITLELHHIDGSHANSHITNLQILCPNCHSQTPNYKGKAKKKKPKPICNDCGIIISPGRKRCRKHSAIHREAMYIANNNAPAHRTKTKIIWPSIQELNEKLKTQSCVSLAKELGVCDKAIIKHIRKWS